MKIFKHLLIFGWLFSIALAVSCSNPVEIDTTLENGQELDTDAEVGFELRQNFPNPFTNNTEIRYRLESEQFVTIKIFTEDWHEVVTLVAQSYAAGTHSVIFTKDENFASGEYYYAMEVGEVIQIRKMIIY